MPSLDAAERKSLTMINRHLMEHILANTKLIKTQDDKKECWRTLEKNVLRFGHSCERCRGLTIRSSPTNPHQSRGESERGV